jgi:hypothetical protein
VPTMRRNVPDVEWPMQAPLEHAGYIITTH